MVAEVNNNIPVIGTGNIGLDKNNNRPETNYLGDEGESDSFSREKLEADKREALTPYIKAQKDINSFADNIDDIGGNYNTTKHASKAVRVVSTLIGLAGTFAISKLGGRYMIKGIESTAKKFASTKTARKSGELVQSGAKVVLEHAKKLGAKLGDKIKPMLENPKLTAKVDAAKNSKVSRFISKIVTSPKVTNAMDTVKGYGEAAKVSVKSALTPDKLRKAAENTLAASTTLSVALDSVLGRNNDKTNLELALGSSGGSQDE